MLKDVTIGQFYNTSSVIHKLDPRVKIRFTIAFVLLTLLDRNIWLFGFLSIIFVLTLLLSKVPFSKVLKGTKGIWIMVFLLSAIHIFTTKGTHIISVGAIAFTKEGVIKFVFVFWRMFLIICFSALLTYTTTPTRLADGFEECLHVSGNIAMGITIAMRFLGVLFDELDRIVKAQEARGAEFHTKSISVWMKNIKNISTPLFQNAINRAKNLGDAMDAKCYTGGKNRTKLMPLYYAGKDILAYLILLGMVIVSIYFVIKF